MTILSPLSSTTGAASVAGTGSMTAAIPTPPVSTVETAAMDSLFKADLAKASQGAAAADEAKPAAAKEGVPEKSISFVSRGSRSGVMSPTQQFESFVLRTFVDSMLPQDNSSYFGTGTAGKIWKSMLAERIGDEMAKDGGIGIAAMLEKRGSQANAVDGAKEHLKQGESAATGAQAFKGLGSI